MGQAWHAARLAWLLLAASSVLQPAAGAATEQPAADAAKPEPYPITVRASRPVPTGGSAEQALVTTTGVPVKISGKTVSLLKNVVTLDIAAPKASPPQSDHLTATAGLDGTYVASYVPRVAGLYEIKATAPDGTGRAVTTFYAENPGAPSPDTANAPIKLLHNLELMVPMFIKAVEDMPPAPNRNVVIDDFHQLQHLIEQLKQPTKERTDEAPPLWRALPPDSKTRPSLEDVYSRARRGVTRTQQELDEIRFDALVCDNMEKVIDGLKLFGAMLDFVASDFTKVINNVRSDYLSTYAGQLTGYATGSGTASFIATERIKNNLGKQDMQAGQKISLANDLLVKAIDGAMQLWFCKMFSGTMKGHMHAEFYEKGEKWWEYDYDLEGIVSLHYPKDGHGQSVPLKGRVEGFAYNFKIWENALATMYPELMASTVTKRFYLMPDQFSAPTAPLLKSVYDVEGSGVAAQLVPNSFFIPLHGTADDTSMEFALDAASFDMDAKARVVVLYLPVLSLLPNVMIIPMQYKPARFALEHAASPYKLTLVSGNDKLTGKQHFENKKGNEAAKGDYTMDVEICSPDCSTSIWDSPSPQ